MNNGDIIAGLSLQTCLRRFKVSASLNTMGTCHPAKPSIGAAIPVLLRPFFVCPIFLLPLLLGAVLTFWSLPGLAEESEAGRTKSVAELDWVPARLLGSNADLGHCDGLYVPPKSNSPEADQEPSRSPLRSTARESELTGNRKVTFSGDVVIQEGYRRLTAEKATYDRETEQMELSGGLLLREPGIAIRADRAMINAQDGTGTLAPADYVLHRQHVRGGAEEISRQADGSLFLSQGTYTRCEPNNNAWVLQGSSFVIDQEKGTGTARNARLKVKGVPIFYSPWLQFPIDERRKTGLLWPSYSNTSTGGIDVAIPYYINLAPNYDATITPRYISNRGLLAEAETRWLNPYGSWVASGSYLSDEEETNRDRWLVALKERGNIGSRIRTSIDFTRVSDDEFFNDLSTRGLEVKRETHLDQLAQIFYTLPSWNISAKLQQFQTIETSILPENEPYKLLPQVRVSRRSLGLPFQLQYGFEAEYSYFDHDIRERGHRLYAEPGLSFPMEWLAGFVKPSIKLKHASYFIDRAQVDNSDDEEQYTVPVFKLDSGLFFERDMTVGDSSYQQTLEPRLFYLNVPEQDQSDIPSFDTTVLTFGYTQLFREDRFTGRDRVGDSDQLTLGLTTRFIDDEGAEKLTASLGQIFYFKDRRVGLPSGLRAEDADATSAVAAEMEYRPTDHLRLTSSFLWDTAEDKIDQGSLQFQYEPEDDILINFAYRYRRDNPLFQQGNSIFGETIEQTDVSAVFPFGKHWRAYLRWQYDLAQESTIEDLVGIEYSDCCWDIRVVYQRGLNGASDGNFAINNSEFELRREHAVYVQFVLRGLGSLGDKIDRILDRSILGYSDFRNNFR
ncbi:MAG: LPS-assembly protein LptD [Pseudomonadales bacterium]